jgi:hypothetical protein
VEKDVLGLDIPMDDVAVMHELNGMAHLLGDASNLLLGKATFRFEIIVDVACTAQFEDEVKVVLI